MQLDSHIFWLNFLYLELSKYSLLIELILFTCHINFDYYHARDAPKKFSIDHFLSLTVATAHLVIRVIVVKLEYKAGQYILLIDLSILKSIHSKY